MSEQYIHRNEITGEYIVTEIQGQIQWERWLCPTDNHVEIARFQHLADAQQAYPHAEKVNFRLLQRGKNCGLSLNPLA